MVKRCRTGYCKVNSSIMRRSPLNLNSPYNTQAYGRPAHIQTGGGVGASPKAKNCRRAYRDKIKSDPEKYKEHKQREKERCQRRKAENKIKSIGNVTEREKRTKRKFWRENNRKRAAQAAIAATVDINGAAALNPPPPPTTP